MQLRQRTMLITGGTSGLGFDLARQLLERGNTVIITSRNSHRLADAQRRPPGSHGVVGDVSDSTAIAALHAQLIVQFPTLDVLVNNAGIMRNLDLSRLRPLEDVAREIDVNLRGPIQMVQQFLPQLRVMAPERTRLIADLEITLRRRPHDGTDPLWRDACFASLTRSSEIHAREPASLSR